MQSDVKNCSTAVALYKKLCLFCWGLKLAVYRKSKTGGGGGGGGGTCVCP